VVIEDRKCNAANPHGARLRAVIADVRALIGTEEDNA
jgi:hypothetical protein